LETVRKTVLVTGATGFVGQWIAHALLDAGYSLRLLVRNPALLSPAGLTPELVSLRYTGPRAPRVEIVPGDVLDGRSLRVALAGADTVVHSAAMVGDGGRAEPYFRVNVDGLRDLLAVASYAPNFRKFILVSSLGVYPARDHFGTDESAAIDTQGIDPYTRTKAIAEKEFVAFCRDRNFPGVALRPGFVYGPGDRIVMPRLVSRLRSGQLAWFGPGTQKLNHTYVRNFADAVVLALETATEPGAVFNITDDPVGSKREFIGAVAQHLNLPIPTRQIPLKVAYTLACGFSGIDRLLGGHGPKFISLASWKFLGLNLDYSIARAKRELGYAPKWSFAEGIRETMTALAPVGAMGTSYSATSRPSGPTQVG